MDRSARTGDVVVIAGGELGTRIAVSPGALVIAADSGYDHAMRAGVAVDVLIGDLDSISERGRLDAESADVHIVAFARDKDHTDLELALREAVGRGATRIDVYGGEGGTLGHLLAGALALTGDHLVGTDVRWHVGTGSVSVARPGRPVTVAGNPGGTVTIVPVGTVRGVRTSGLRWRLDGDTLGAGSTRGVSNELDDHQATVQIDEGTALVISEGA